MGVFNLNIFPTCLNRQFVILRNIINLLLQNESLKINLANAKMSIQGVLNHEYMQYQFPCCFLNLQTKSYDL